MEQLNELVSAQNSDPDKMSLIETSIKKLQDGNQRYVEAQHDKKDTSHIKRRELLGGQKPFAVILSCSDSRVPPELIFDQGLGELFIVRVAGNVADAVAIGSIEYAVEHLESSLLVIMGHSKCGAIKATAEGKDVSPNLEAIATKLMPAVQIAMTRNSSIEDIIEDAVVENVKRVMQSVRIKSSVINEHVDNDLLKIVGAKYDLESGVVTFFEHVDGVYREFLPGGANAGL